MMKLLARRRSYALGWLLATTLLAGCAHDLQRGQDALNAGDFPRAEALARQELEREPDSPTASLLLAEALAGRGDHQGALQPALRAENSGEFGERAAALVARIYEALNDASEAALAYLRARQHAPSALDDAQMVALLERGITHAEVRRQYNLLIQLRPALRALAPEHPAADRDKERTEILSRSYDLTQRDKSVEAIELLEDALATDPSFEQAAGELGSYYASLDLKEQALRIWHTTAAEFDEPSRRQEILSRFAQRAVDANAPGVAVELLNEAIALLTAPDEELPPLYQRLASAHLSLNQPDRAEEALRASLNARTSPPNAATYTELARLAINEGAPELALTLLLEAPETLAPDWAFTSTLGNLLAARARLDEVEALLNRFVEANPPAHLSLRHAAGWAHERNNFELARSLYERALQYPQTDPMAYRALGLVLLELKEREAMLEAFYAYLKAVDHRVEPTLEIATQLQHERFFEEARAILRRLGDQQHQNIVVAQHLAGLYMAWGRPSDAEAAFEAWIDARGNQDADILLVATRFARFGEPGRALHFYQRSARGGNAHSWLNIASIHLEQARYSAMSQALDTYLEAIEPELRSNALQHALAHYRQAAMPARIEATLVALVDAQPNAWRFAEQLSDHYFLTGRDQQGIDTLVLFIERAEQPRAAFDRILRLLLARERATAALPLAHRIFAGRDDFESSMALGDVYDAVQRGASEQDAAAFRRRALKHYRRALKLAAPSSDWRSLAERWHRAHYFEVAAPAFEQALKAGVRPAELMFAYAEALLELGQHQRAETLLEQFHRDASRSLNPTITIAELLVEHQRYTAAEPYLNYAFASANETARRQAFTMLATLYRSQDRLDEIDALIDSYLAGASNTLVARQMVLSVLENAGMWDSAITQLERIATMGPGEQTYLIALNHFRAGRTDQATELLTAWATKSARAEAWIAAADFLANHGQLDRAIPMLNQGIARLPGERSLRLSRARLHARAGAVDAALEDAAFCREDPDTCDPAHLRDLSQTLAAAGYEGHVEALLGAHAPSAQHLSAPPIGRAHPDLLTGDPARARAWVEKVQTHGLPLFEVVNRLDQSGHYALSNELITTEMSEGDPATASALLLNRQVSATPGAALSDPAQALRRVVDPLERSNERFIGPLGDAFLRMGRTSEAMAYLRAAVDAGDTTYRGQLAHTLILNRQVEEGFQHLLRSVLESPQPSAAIDSAVLRLNLTQRPDLVARLLDDVAARHTHTAGAFPLKILHDLDSHGDIATSRAEIDRHLAWLQGLQGANFGGRQASVVTEDAILGALEAIASQGYVDDALAHLDTLPDALQNAPRASRLRLRAALLRGDTRGADQATDAWLASSDHDQDAALALAQDLLAFSELERASALLNAARERSPGNLRIFSGQLAILRARGASEDQVSQATDAFLQVTADPQLARQNLIDTLHNLGYSESAHSLAIHDADLTPVGHALTRALNSAIYQGDVDQVRALIDPILRTDDNAGKSLQDALSRALSAPEPAIPLTILDGLQRLAPAALKWKLARIELLLRTGDIEEARTQIRNYIDQTGAQLTAIDGLIVLLENEFLDVELARVVAPALEGQALSPLHLSSFAAAELALGFPERADHWLERLDRTPNAAALRLTIARKLYRRRHYQPALHALGPALPDEDATRRAARLTAQLGLGQASADDLIDAMADGLPSISVLYDGLVAAFEGSDPVHAVSLMATLVATPATAPNLAAQNLQLVLLAAVRASPGRGRFTTIRFLDEHLPHLHRTARITWSDVTAQFASVNEAHAPDAAYDIYRDVITSSLVTSPEQSPLPIAMNNLAYLYATTNKHTDQGLDLVNRAMALAGERNASYIDTLGWLHFRQGDLDTAEKEIRRALRALPGDTQGLVEINDHLAEILRARGRYHEATWIQLYADRLRERSLFD
ncbi:hypothetical protein DL240_12005 [Lujinxingia litoralis]|uniref:Tetratricopeptide repeat protein n=1 Tax=Lujinxingia litoralis TaxID=2211119 RepID=A0A328C3H1_9DELT|nr:tetratricopeptide repeat protein [Lujinxingia litoralis]RAL21574.1 hypothetical protein DL240_12005 [Lujinxingia litoralis]